MLVGADQLSDTCPFPGVAVKLCGAVGVVLGVADAFAAVPFPAAFIARTLNAYDVPFVRPVKVWAVLLVGVTQVLPPSRDT